MYKRFTDQLGNTIEISYPPERIISVVPSQTELLFDLGLEREIIGVTNFCIHPKEKCDSKIKIGGTKKLDIDKISELHPDLVLANKEENSKAEIEFLQKKFPVWVSDIKDLETALSMIHSAGEITDKISEANIIASRIKKSFDELDVTGDKRVAYFIWRKPYMTVGGDTFIQHMLTVSGFYNVFSGLSRYPVISPEELINAKPDFIFLSSEPYPFSEKHIQEFQAICPETKVLLVDGEYFSWYGSRLLGAANYLKELIERVRK